jgi:hypothetical protein
MAKADHLALCDELLQEARFQVTAASRGSDTQLNFDSELERWGNLSPSRSTAGHSKSGTRAGLSNAHRQWRDTENGAAIKDAVVQAHIPDVALLTVNHRAGEGYAAINTGAGNQNGGAHYPRRGPPHGRPETRKDFYESELRLQMDYNGGYPTMRSVSGGGHGSLEDASPFESSTHHRDYCNADMPLVHHPAGPRNYPVSSMPAAIVPGTYPGRQSYESTSSGGSQRPRYLGQHDDYRLSGETTSTGAWSRDSHSSGGVSVNHSSGYHSDKGDQPRRPQYGEDRRLRTHGPQRAPGNDTLRLRNKIDTTRNGLAQISGSSWRDEVCPWEKFEDLPETPEVKVEIVETEQALRRKEKKMEKSSSWRTKLAEKLLEGEKKE